MDFYRDVNTDFSKLPYRMSFKFFDDPMFDGLLNQNDKVIFGYLLDRYRLSVQTTENQIINHLPTQFVNKEGLIYCVYPIEDIAKDTGFGQSTIKNSIAKFKQYQFIKIEKVIKYGGSANQYMVYDINDIKQNLNNNPELLVPIDKFTEKQKNNYKVKKSSEENPIDGHNMTDTESQNDCIESHNMTYTQSLNDLTHGHETTANNNDTNNNDINNKDQRKKDKTNKDQYIKPKNIYDQSKPDIFSPEKFKDEFDHYLSLAKLTNDSSKEDYKNEITKLYGKLNTDENNKLNGILDENGIDRVYTRLKNIKEYKMYLYYNLFLNGKYSYDYFVKELYI